MRQGDLTVAIGTGGASPALARRLREDLQQRFGPEYRPYLALLKGVRMRLLGERRGHPENASLFLRLVDKPLLEAVIRDDRSWVAAMLREVLGGVLSPQILGEIIAEAFKEAQG